MLINTKFTNLMVFCNYLTPEIGFVSKTFEDHERPEKLCFSSLPKDWVWVYFQWMKIRAKEKKLKNICFLEKFCSKIGWETVKNWIYWLLKVHVQEILHLWVHFRLRCTKTSPIHARLWICWIVLCIKFDSPATCAYMHRHERVLKS